MQAAGEPQEIVEEGQEGAENEQLGVEDDSEHVSPSVSADAADAPHDVYQQEPDDMSQQEPGTEQLLGEQQPGAQEAGDVGVVAVAEGGGASTPTRSPHPLSIGAKISGHVDVRQRENNVPRPAAHHHAMSPQPRSHSVQGGSVRLSAEASGRASPLASNNGSLVGPEAGGSTGGEGGAQAVAGSRASAAGSTGDGGNGGVAAAGSEKRATSPGAGIRQPAADGRQSPNLSSAAASRGPSRNVSKPGTLPPKPGRQNNKNAAAAAAPSPPPLQLPPVKGVPLLNALAQLIKGTKQKIVAVYSLPVFLGEECLAGGEGGEGTKRAHTAVTTAPTEYISIPKAVILSALPAATAESVGKRMQGQQAKAMLTGAPANKVCAPVLSLESCWPSGASGSKDQVHVHMYNVVAPARKGG